MIYFSLLGASILIAGAKALVEGLTNEAAPSSNFGSLPSEKGKRTKFRKKMIKKIVAAKRRELCLDCEKHLSSQQDKIGKTTVDFDGDSTIIIKFLDIEELQRALAKASALLEDTQAVSIKKETYTVSLPPLSVVTIDVAESALDTYGTLSGINTQDYYEQSKDEFVIKLERIAK